MSMSYQVHLHVNMQVHSNLPVHALMHCWGGLWTPLISTPPLLLLCDFSGCCPSAIHWDGLQCRLYRSPAACGHVRRGKVWVELALGRQSCWGCVVEGRCRVVIFGMAARSRARGLRLSGADTLRSLERNMRPACQHL